MSPDLLPWGPVALWPGWQASVWDPFAPSFWGFPSPLSWIRCPVSWVPVLGISWLFPSFCWSVLSDSTTKGGVWAEELYFENPACPKIALFSPHFNWVLVKLLVKSTITLLPHCGRSDWCKLDTDSKRITVVNKIISSCTCYYISKKCICVKNKFCYEINAGSCYGLNCVSPKLICWSPNRNPLPLNVPVLEMGLLRR